MKKKFGYKESRGLPGGPNEMFTYVTGVFSTEGYKANSPDVNNPFNIIPSGNITMEGVNFPVRGTDNLGNTKVMMPGNNYKFPGDIVFETPTLYAKGGPLSSINIGGNTIYGVDNMEDYITAYNEGRVLNYNKDGQLDAGELPEIMIGSKGTNYPNYGKLTTEEKKLLNNKGNSPIKRAIEAKALYGESLTADQIKGVTQGLIYNPLIGGAQAPQSAMVEGIEALRGKPYDLRNILFPSTQRIPSETWGVENPVGAFAVDVLADPQLIGGLVRGIGKSGAKQIGKYLTEETALKNTYKYNPRAFKPNPNSYYRGVGDNAIDDALQTGVVRQNPNGQFKGQALFASPYFKLADNMYATLPTYRGHKKGMIEIPKEIGNFKIDDVDGLHFRGDSEIPISDVKLYKQDWLRGYKEVKVPKTTSSVDDVGTGNIKSIVNSTKNEVSTALKGTSSLLDQILGELKQGKLNKKSIAEGNKWLQNWINSPYTQQKIHDDINKARKIVEDYSNPSDVKTQKELLDLIEYQSKTFTPNSKEYSLLKQFKDNLEQYTKIVGFNKNKNIDPIHKGNWGVSYQHGINPYKRQFVSNNPKNVFDRYGSWISRATSLSPKKRISTTIHEGTHDWVSAEAFKKSGMRNTVLENMDPKIKELFLEWEKLRKEGIDPASVMGKDRAHQAYLANPTEMHARIMELRYDLGIPSWYKIDSKNAREILEWVGKGGSKVDPRFLDVIGRDPKKLAYLFNKLWASPPVVIGAGAVGANQLTNQQPESYKRGGSLPKAQDRGELYEPTSLPIDNTKTPLTTYSNPDFSTYISPKNKTKKSLNALKETAVSQIPGTYAGINMQIDKMIPLALMLQNQPLYNYPTTVPLEVLKIPANPAVDFLIDLTQNYITKPLDKTLTAPKEHIDYINSDIPIFKGGGSLPKAQDGEELFLGDNTIYGVNNVEDYRKAYNENRVLSYNNDGQLEKTLDPVTIVADRKTGKQYPYYDQLTEEEEKYINKSGPIGNYVRGIAEFGKIPLATSEYSKNFNFAEQEAVDSRQYNRPALETKYKEALVEKYEEQLVKQREEERQKKLQLKDYSKSSPQEIEKLQTQLVKEGYNVGPTGVDKIYGKNTKAAYKAMVEDDALDLSTIDRYYNKFRTQGADKRVAGIQSDLVKAGFLKPDQIDGKFGNITKAAIERYNSGGKEDITGLAFTAPPKRINDIRCAAGMCKVLEGQDIPTAELGMKYADAWDMFEKMNNAGHSKTIYNMYTDPAFKNIKTASEIKAATNRVKKTSQTTADMYKVGDIVGLYHAPSSHHADTLNSKTHNTHVGWVQEIKNGVPIIAHNLDGKIFQQPYTDLITTWIQRPDSKYIQLSRASNENLKYKPENLNAPSAEKNISRFEIKIERKLKPDEKQIVSNVMNRAHVSSRQLVKELESTVDPNWVERTVFGITGAESAGGINAPRTSSDFDWKRRAAHTIKGAEEEEKSYGVGKVKFNGLDGFSKNYFNINSPADLADDNKNVDVITYNLIKAYETFKDYSKNFPELGLTETDLRNMAILAHNQGMIGLLQTGRSQHRKTLSPKEEVELLRTYYSGTVKDVSATNYKYLGGLGETIYDLVGNEYEAYISKVNRYANEVYNPVTESLQKVVQKPIENLQEKEGGELTVYKDYVNGLYQETPKEDWAKQTYDKLNRIYYKSAKDAGMSVPNYIMSKLVVL